MKICSKCKIDKQNDQFHKDKYKKDGLKTICILCHKEYRIVNKDRDNEKGKEYYENNKSSIFSKKKIYRKKNQDHFTNYRREYYLENIEKHKKYSKSYYEENKIEILNKFKERLKNDPLFKLIQNVKTNIRNSLTKSGYSKKTKTFKILGIEYNLFGEYIENQFKDGMNWENYGKWHLDHKTPISWAKNEEEAILLCHYTNYQPLWALENISKGNRYKSN